MKKTRLFTRLTAVMLALLMLVMASACATGDNGDTPADTTTAAPSGNNPSGDSGNSGNTADTDPANPADTTAGSADTTVGGSTPIAPVLDEYGREIIEPDLPDVKYDGETFTVHTRGNVEQYEWLAKDQTGDRLNDAIYARNLAVEDKYGITLEVIAEGTWSNYAKETLPAMQASILAGNGAYDLIAGYSSPIANMVTTGQLYDLNDLQYIDFDKPWWWQNFTEASSIEGTNYFALGALSLSAIYSLSCVYFNPTMLEETNPGTDLYQIVLDGKWTWDKMTELASHANSDLDGNSTMDLNDRFGIVMMTGNNPNNQYVVASGEKISTIGADGSPAITLDQEKMSNVIDNVIKLFYENEYCYMGKQADVRKMFIDGKALFHSEWLYYAQTQIAGQVEKYGLVPTPKMNDAQEDYCAWIQGGMHMYCIPIDVKDTERAAILTEAFAAETYRTLLPQYYEIVLKAKYFKDEASSQMMDIMYDSVSFDFARIYDGQLSLLTTINTTISSKQNTFASAYKGASKVAEKKLEQLLETVAKNSK